MNITSLLNFAGVPAEFHESAHTSLALAAKRFKGLTLAKWKVRLFKAQKIADILSWEDERLVDVAPHLAKWDIAPMLNVTAHGDNVPWVQTANGDRPLPGQWLNTDPTSAEYKFAVSRNYWCKGTHPRSTASRKAWYRRNAGEYTAWEQGEPVEFSGGVNVWQKKDSTLEVRILKCGDVWQLLASKKLAGSLHWDWRIGFEIDNVWRGKQVWFPIPGVDLRAPVTWNKLPTFKK